MMSNPYSSTIQAMIDTLLDLDNQITHALYGMNEMQSEILSIEEENQQLEAEVLELRKRFC